MASYLGIITPTNFAAEKERFFSSNNYSPQLEYNWSRQTIDRFIQKTPKGKPLVDAMLSQDGMAITAAASNFFDVKFRENDLKFAQELIAHTPISSNGTAEAYAQLMRQKLASLDIDYSVEVVDQHGFQAHPNHKKRVLKISKYLHLQFLSLDDIASHELAHITSVHRQGFSRCDSCTS